MEPTTTYIIEWDTFIDESQKVGGLVSRIPERTTRTAILRDFANLVLDAAKSDPMVVRATATIDHHYWHSKYYYRLPCADLRLIVTVTGSVSAEMFVKALLGVKA